MTTTTRLIPEGLLATLAAIEPAAPWVLFIRHAERAPFDPAQPYGDVDLTAHGREQATHLGQHLPLRPAWAAVSAYLRCRRTAELLGIKTAEADARLGWPGPFVTDEQAGARLFAELGTEGVVRAQLSGTCWPFVRAQRAGTEILLSAAIDRLSAERGCGICVSHDIILMPAIALLTGEPFTDSWLAPLDGFALQRHRDGLCCIFAGRRFALPQSW